jgi:hypothetical protein
MPCPRYSEEATTQYPLLSIDNWEILVANGSQLSLRSKYPTACPPRTLKNIAQGKSPPLDPHAEPMSG